jgi:GTP cyclohydrolase I
MNDNFNIETLPITEQIKTNYEDIIHLLGEDKLREGLLKTPERASKAMKFLTEGYEKTPNRSYKEPCLKKITMKWSLSKRLNCILCVSITCYLSSGKLM